MLFKANLERVNKEKAGKNEDNIIVFMHGGIYFGLKQL